MRSPDRLPVMLFLLRFSVFFVMFMWTLDKFVRPEHAATVYEHFYFIGGLSHTAFYLLGALELALIAGFLIGFLKRLTYGAILLLHGISTISSFRQYLSPFQDANLLFYAAWPMFAACLTLYYLRDLDRLWVVDK